MSNMEQTNYQTSFERHYTALLGMLTYFFTQLAEQLIEIAARAVMIFAPMPNAISMFNIVQREQDFTVLQALAFSFTLEIVVFLLVEIALVMWNGYLTNPRAYRWPFVLMTGVVLVATFIVVFMVYALEPHKVMAWLPVVSLCSFVAIGLKRWHERNQAASDDAETATGNLEQLRTELEAERKRAEKMRISTEALRNGAEEMRIAMEQLRTELEAERKRAQVVDLDAVLSRLDDGSREVLAEIIRLVTESRITSAADAAKEIEANKTKVYEIFRLANAIGIIYPNGDGAYHVNA